VLGLIGFFGATFGPTDRPREGHTGYRWGMIVIFATIPLTGLLFYVRGYEFITVSVDVIVTPLVLLLWLYADREKLPVENS
jgi:hypothetical protein